jgi:hypothetical protein
LRYANSKGSLAYYYKIAELKARLINSSCFMNVFTAKRLVENRMFKFLLIIQVALRKGFLNSNIEIPYGSLVISVPIHKLVYHQLTADNISITPNKKYLHNEDISRLYPFSQRKRIIMSFIRQKLDSGP